MKKTLSVLLALIYGDKIKFGENASDFQHITDRIDAELFGLFPFEPADTQGRDI